jgi:hypothetical protein
MPFNQRLQTNLHFPIAAFLLWSFLFAIAYSQSPLYTSNQNQYFLHGFAQAGIGYLNYDWLANTMDPAPLFSKLVELTVRFLRADVMFYIFYALLMGVYLFGLLAIASQFPSPATERVGREIGASTALLALLFLVHSAGLRFTLTRLLGANWTYVLEDGAADQRMLGPVFEPSVFGVFLLVSVVLFLQQRPFLAVISAVLAATFHATYVLPAGMLVFTYMVILWIEQRNLRQPLLVGALGVITVFPVMAYSYCMFSATSGEISAQAHHILVYFRIPHHALPDRWLDATVAVKLVLIAAAIYVVRKNRLFLLLTIPTLLGIGLTLVQIAFKNDDLALLFPWRISILLLPLSVTVLLTRLVNKALDWLQSKKNGWFQIVNVFGLGVILICVLVGGVRFWLDLQRKQSNPEQALFDYVAANKQPGETYLIPVKMQDFRLATGAPAYIEFKSIPYHDLDVMEWYRRINMANRFYDQPDCAMVPGLLREGITHVVVEGELQSTTCAGWKMVYRDSTYHVLALKSP